MSTRSSARPSLLRATLLVALGAPGCFGGGSDPAGGSPVASGNLYGQGSILVAWTVDGKVPSAEACAGIDGGRFTLALEYAGGGLVSIDPVPCSLTRFRYDQLPEGTATVVLTYAGAAGRCPGSASAPIVVGPTTPTAPTPTLSVVTPTCR